MSMDKQPRDRAAREQALDPQKSFIVQAPAGSGKTGLLTQRYLRLLAGVESPESIIAITFTRKAAAEMRNRILEALDSAQSDKPPENSHRRLTWQLARSALEQDAAMDWRLIENPSRLRIQTIDSLCQSLSRQTPLLSRFGSMPGVTEDARPYYREAARAVLDELEGDSKLSDAIAQLLRHRDNRMEELQSLIAAMLARRDQWLRLVAPQALDDQDPQLRRGQIESVLERLVEEALARLAAALPQEAGEVLPGLVTFAAKHAKAGSLINQCTGIDRVPGCDSADLSMWQCIAELLLTKNRDPKWRSPRGVNKTLGFPSRDAGQTTEEKLLFVERKQAMQQLLESLEDMDELRLCLAGLKYLPSPAYSDDEWRLLDDLFRLLLRSAQHLQLVFGQRGEVDFIEMAMSAARALGDEDNPSDLTLRLDYQIRHLLVDEFQDTSQNQYDLFDKLVAGWTPGDGRTLFLVGDPMQSIYRFREAEVGLFLQAWEGRLGHVELERLKLSVNFRSQQGVIDWVNDAFPRIMPQDNNKVHGAVSYTASDSFNPALPGDAVTVHAMLDTDDSTEAECVLGIIDQAQKEHPDGSIAILLRSKMHVADIVRLLKQQDRKFQAVEIDKLSQRPVVKDLLALSCALLHPGDRISWLAILRAPWCGLTLADLHALVGGDQKVTVYDQLIEMDSLFRLSDDGAARLGRTLPILQTTLLQRGRLGLRAWVEGAWIALGGPACLSNDTDRKDAEVFLHMLETIDESGKTAGPETLHDKVAELFALPDAHANSCLQIMTMHKAKGLEFDTVILPGLGRTTRGDESRLLYWLQRTSETGEPELVFGPIKSAREKENRTAEYIKQLDKEKSQYEYGRLLYVAATRARQRLHLLGQVKTDNETGEVKEPGNTTLLYQFWPVVSEIFEQRAALVGEGESGQNAPEGSPLVANRLRRLVPGWTCPSPPTGVHTQLDQEEEREFELEFDWASESARVVGTVVHRILEQLTRQSGAADKDDDLARFSMIGRQMLKQEGLPGDQLDDAANKIKLALENTLQDERGSWILSNTHQDAHSEYALSHHINEQVQHLIIDRTFIDDDGVRWIIDYKTGSHAGGGLDEFLDREQDRYRSQLENYATAMSSMDDRPIRLGLYFPLLCGWREWRFDT